MFRVAFKMVISIAVLITASVLSQTFGTSQQSVFYQDRKIRFGNLKRVWGKRLEVEKVKSFMVKNHEFDCPFKCLDEPKCFSFNVATFPDTKGFHLCELLATDKYRAKNMLQTNVSFNHWSPLVSSTESFHFHFDCIDSSFEFRAHFSNFFLLQALSYWCNLMSRLPLLVMHRTLGCLKIFRNEGYYKHVSKL